MTPVEYMVIASEQDANLYVSIPEHNLWSHFVDRAHKFYTRSEADLFVEKNAKEIWTMFPAVTKITVVKIVRSYDDVSTMLRPKT